MPLYSVTIERQILVIADDRDDAAEVASEWIDESIIPDSYQACKIDHKYQVPEGVVSAIDGDGESIAIDSLDLK